MLWNLWEVGSDLHSQYQIEYTHKQKVRWKYQRIDCIPYWRMILDAVGRNLSQDQFRHSLLKSLVIEKCFEPSCEYSANVKRGWYSLMKCHSILDTSNSTVGYLKTILTMWFSTSSARVPLQYLLSLTKAFWFLNSGMVPTPDEKCFCFWLSWKRSSPKFKERIGLNISNEWSMCLTMLKFISLNKSKSTSEKEISLL